MTPPDQLLLPVIVGPRGRTVLAWILALGLTIWLGWRAWHAFDGQYFEEPADRTRVDGNLGHVLVDFGSQWLMARMLVTGHGPELYHRDVQHALLTAAYPRSDEGLDQQVSDADRLFEWLVTVPRMAPDDPSIGGALYPPVQAVLFAPLGRLEPRPAYRLTQYCCLALTWFAGAVFASISRGRVWWPMATSVLMVFPGYMGALYLAQNSIISLTILLSGWWLVTRDRPLAGGAVWGLLAFKPTWAAAFLLVPLLTRRWRMLVGMIGVGGLLGLATLPLVGIQPWFDWLHVGREAAAAYDIDDNWVLLGRDLLGVPRRWLIDFSQPRELRSRPAATIAGWTLWAGVVLTTFAVAWRRHDRVRDAIGSAPAFVGLGAWLSCFHFIYYDVLLAAFPFALLLSDTRSYLRTVRVIFLNKTAPPDPAALSHPGPNCFVNSFVLNCLGLLVVFEQFLPLLKLDISVTVGVLPTGGRWPNPLLFSTRQAGTPWDTFILLAVWAYCGWHVLRERGPAEP